MKRGIAIAFALLVPPLAACWGPVGTAVGFQPDTCAELDGDFTATGFNVIGAEDPSLVNDFSTNGDIVDLSFDTDTFTSTFTPSAGDPVVTTGTFNATADTVFLDAGADPFVPGFEPGPVRLDCEFDPDTGAFTLTGDTPFDFDDDGVFDPATLTGTFDPI